MEKVLGIDTPAYKAGLKAGDVLVEVQGELITMMTHPQVNIKSLNDKHCQRHNGPEC